MADLEILIEMGFTQCKAEKALVATGNNGVEPAMEWLLAHADDPGIDTPVEKKADEESPKGNVISPALGCGDEKLTDMAEAFDGTSSITCEARSLKCDECGKRFRSDAEVEFHAIKSGHQSFSESAEEIKPLSDEEKKEKLRKVEEIIKQRRLDREEHEKREALEKEKSRRRTGQEIAHMRQKMQEEEMKRVAEQTRKEKLEAKLARQRVLEEIENDKKARKLLFQNKSDDQQLIPEESARVPAPVPVVTEFGKEYDQCKLQIRLTNGQCLTQTFSPNEELAAVRLYVEINRSDGEGPFSLMTNFPKRIFSEEDMSAPLSSLGLVPSAVLIVTKRQ